MLTGLDVVTDSHHLAHDASVMPLWCTAGGRFEASAAAAPAVHQAISLYLHK